MKKECYAMIYLVACGVNRIKPDMKYISDIDMEVLFRLSTYHLVEVIEGSRNGVTGAVDSETFKIHEKKYTF